VPSALRPRDPWHQVVHGKGIRAAPRAGTTLPELDGVPEEPRETPPRACCPPRPPSPTNCGRLSAAPTRGSRPPPAWSRAWRGPPAVPPRVAAGHRPRGFYSALREEVGAVGPGMMSQTVVALHCEGSRLFDLSRSRRTWSRSAVRSTMRRSSSAGVCVEQCDDVAARRPFLLADGDDLSDLAQGQSGGLGGFDERQPSHSVLVVVPVARLLSSRFGQHTACSWNRSVFAVRLDRSASSPMRRP